MSDRTYVFDNAESGCGGMNGLIASLCQNRGVDPNALLAMMNNGNGFGGNGNWFWIVLFLIFGWGGFGGNGFGRGGNAQGLADLGNLVNNDAGRELLMQAINGNGQAISQLASTLSCDVNALQNHLSTIQQSLCQIGANQGLNAQQVINAIQSGNAGLASQFAQCCCDIRTSIERQGFETRIALSEQTNTLSSKIDAQTQAMNAQFCALEKRELEREIRALQEAKSTLLGQISNDKQTAVFGQMIGQATAPANAALADLSARLAKIECSLPPTVAVPYPQLRAFNPEVVQAAAFGSAVGYNNGFGFGRNGNCGCNQNTFWS